MQLSFLFSLVSNLVLKLNLQSLLLSILKLKILRDFLTETLTNLNHFKTEKKQCICCV